MAVVVVERDKGRNWWWRDGGEGERMRLVVVR